MAYDEKNVRIYAALGGNPWPFLILEGFDRLFFIFDCGALTAERGERRESDALRFEF